MESLEQRFVLGHFLGGTIWLGGPVTASLLLHAVALAIVVLLTMAAIRFFEPRALRMICALLASIAYPPVSASPLSRRCRSVRAARWTLSHEVAKKRGPPAPCLSI
jgi:hypothetical protein